MPSEEPRPLDRRRTLIAPIVLGGVIVALLVVALVWKGREPAPEKPSPVAATPAPAAIPAPAPAVLPPPPLSRRDLINAESLAAAAYASATLPDKSAGADLVGRRFALHIPFGCDGPQVTAGSAQAYFEVDPDRKTTKLVARPGDWTNLPAIPQTAAGEKVEHVEGFWLPRPWSFAETCPPRRDAPVPATPTPVASQTIGLAQVFGSEGSRVLRRDGRAYEFVKKVTEGQPAPLTTSYSLVLEGRIVGFGDAQAIRCWSETADHRPICLYGVEFDRVAFEDQSGVLLSEWRN